MAGITNLFWNEEGHRLRALWRLLIVASVWFISFLVIQLVIGLIVGMVALSTNALTVEQLGDMETMSDYIANLVWMMPVVQVAQFLVTLGVIWLAGRFLDRRRFADFGLQIDRNWWIDFGFGLFLGAMLMTIIFGVESTTGWATVSGSYVAPPASSFVVAILLAILSFILVGFNEELLSRGYLLTNMAEGFNWKSIGPRGAIVIATLLSSAVFGALHLANPHTTAISTFNIFLAGILLALGYILTGKLAIPIGLHITWNFFQGNVFGFPVSGTAANSTTFIAIQQTGPDLWTGGTFGPEAGLIGILAMLLGALLTVAWVYWRYGSAGLHRPIAEAPKQPGSIASTANVEQRMGER